MKVLVLSSLFPNAVQRRHGIFIEHRLAHTLSPADEARVIAPVPWFPFAGERWGRYGEMARVAARENRRGLQIEHPRYPVVPKVGQTIGPMLMAASLYGPLRRLRRTFDFDVIDAYYLYPDGVAAAWLAKRFDRPLVMSALGTDVSLIPHWAPSRAMILDAVRQSSATTAVCGALVDALAEMGAPPEKLHVVEHGVDLELFVPPVNRSATRARQGFDGPTVLSVGHLIERKGHDFAIRAIAEMPGVRLVIAGDGPCEGALRQLAQSQGVADRVRFLGHVDQADLPDLYGGSDVTVLCSDREGIANVLLESIACGTPLVATPVWGSPDVVRVPEAGVLAADRSDEAIRSALQTLLGNLPDRVATRRYAERYDWAETGRQHRALLQRAVAEHRRS
ncbi:Glycosyltransferase involved in cell wall bisynthesis [Sphingomonas gellani]|uniref:Glycosyltransferase involved in cell wall bisynthesis n=1 Tax=Sphingomonas gellani TaxID=1166340 RepID=A0A1H8EZY0_9SPHN|nr:glycosyltransferase [Sphingomonas gellani]SEN24704.1 Glycosyltransferase involved in cell wall bisynthesis [Sphingomonas gellani]